MHKIFVYGTLKRGYSNHYWLWSLKGTHAVAPGIDLHAGPFYPFAVRGRGRAKGEVYEVSEVVLKQLDDLEDHPQDYHRELTPVILPSGTIIQAWIYLNNKAYLYPLIVSGNW